jgi:hypothetical protein
MNRFQDITLTNDTELTLDGDVIVNGYTPMQRFLLFGGTPN